MDMPIRFLLLPIASALLLACSPTDPPSSQASDAARTPVGDNEVAAGGAATAAEPTVTDAWIRSAPPGASALAGYAMLQNPGASAVSVRTCHTDGFATTEVHQTLHEDGMARMRPVDSLTVPPGGQLMLVPGGHHLMLTGPAESPAEGDTVMVCLSVDGVDREVAFAVRDASGAAMSHEHDHAGGHEH